MTVKEYHELGKKIEELTDDEQFMVYKIIKENDDEKKLNIKQKSMMFNIKNLNDKTISKLKEFIIQCDDVKNDNIKKRMYEDEHDEMIESLEKSLQKKSEEFRRINGIS